MLIVATAEAIVLVGPVLGFLFHHKLAPLDIMFCGDFARSSFVGRCTWINTIGESRPQGERARSSSNFGEAPY